MDSTSNLNNRLYLRFLDVDKFYVDDVKVIKEVIEILPEICDPGFEANGTDWTLAVADGGAGTGDVQTTDVYNELQSYEANMTMAGANP